MLDDNALEQRGCNCAIPHAFRIHDDNRATLADSETRSLSALHTRWAEEQSFALKQRGEERIQCPTAPLRGAEPTRADDDVPRIRFHRAW
jgi:hypothetical protein